MESSNNFAQPILVGRLGRGLNQSVNRPWTKHLIVVPLLLPLAEPTSARRPVFALTLHLASAGAVVGPRLIPSRLVPLYVRPGGTPIGEGEDLPRQLLNGAQQSALAVIAERDRDSFGAGARRAADSMHIGLGYFRKLIIHDMGNVVDIDAASRNIGRNEDAAAPRPKAIKRALPLRLALVAVDRRRVYAGRREMLRHAVGAALRPGKHDRTLKIRAPEQFDEKVALVGVIYEKDLLHDALDRGRHRRHRDFYRIMQNFGGEPGDLLWHRGREEQALAILWNAAQDLPDRDDEAEIEHVIGLVEDDDLGRIEPQIAARQMVEQTSRRRHEDIDAPRQRLDLRTDADAADNGRNGNAGEPAIGTETVGDLRGKFPGWREHEGAHAARRRRAPVGDEALEDWQGEGRGLAGARLGNTKQITPFEKRLDGLRLDWRGLRVTFVLEGTQQDLGQAEIGELLHVNSF